MKYSKINDPFSSLPAFALHNFKASNINKCTTDSCLWFSSISSSSAKHSPCLGKHGRGCGNIAQVDDWLLLLSLKCSLDESPSISIIAPCYSRNFVSPSSLSPLSKALQAGGDSGDPAAPCPHRGKHHARVQPGRIRVSCLGLPHAISYPRTVQEQF